jgi:serine protease Do
MPDFADLVTRVRPAVVQVTNELKAEAADDEGPAPGPFGQSPFGQFGPHGHAHAHAVEARGSGFLIDADGTIVTNNHVVRGAKSVSVTLDDGTVLPAKIVGRDARTDLAVLRIDAGHKLPFIELGDSAKVRPGEWVIAMGNPFGLGGTVTAGIVSADHRDIGEGPYDSFIQVDAPINQGNSGGPLFTQDGRVVGVNSAIISPSGGSVGIGFAIPSDMVRKVVAEIEKDGHVTRGYLGVETQAVSADLRKALKLPEGKGALIASVEPGTPAAKAGLQPGDVVTAVDGTAVTSPRDLALDIAAIKPGSDTKIELLRDGSQQSVTAQITLLTPTATASAEPGNGGKPSIGLALAPLTPEARQELDLPAKTKGAVVAEVQPGSPAEAAGLRQGDVLVGVGSKPVTSPEDAVGAIREARQNGDTVALRVMRDGHTSYVAVEAAKGQTAPGTTTPDSGDDDNG